MSGLKALIRQSFDLVMDPVRFGPQILRRHWTRANEDGYTKIRTKYGDFSVRKGESDFGVFRQVFQFREYNLDNHPQSRWVQNAYEDCLRRNQLPLIIDAGANVGFATRFFADRFPKAHIVAIEPEPDNFKLCEVNTAHLSNVTCFEAALGTGGGYVDVTTARGNSCASTVKRSENGTPVYSIQQIKRMFQDAVLLVAKIDIEGFESDLFSQDTEWVGETHLVVVEPHDWLIPGGGTSIALQKIMAQYERDMIISGENLMWFRRPSPVRSSVRVESFEYQ